MLSCTNWGSSRGNYGRNWNLGELLESLEKFELEAEVYICFSHPWLAMRAEAVRRKDIRHFYEKEEDFQVAVDTIPDRK
jgi:hypothetical protein